MRDKLASLFNFRREPARQAQPDQADLMLALEKELQSLRLELEARDRRIGSLQHEIERLAERQEQVQAEVTAARMEGLFTEIASPASQLLTQADLLERQGKPVQAEDVLAIARRIIRMVERHGVKFEGQPGEQVIYDPALHTPLNQSGAPQPGQPVTIRFAGVFYRSKVIYKAVVEF
jgi:molecular chaperone GrpE (heat shock protein)